MSGVIRDTLTAECWDVSLREDGESALVEIEGAAPYDLIITDYQLPGADGVRLTRAARATRHRPRTPVVMFTASRVEREANKAALSASGV